MKRFRRHKSDQDADRTQSGQGILELALAMPLLLLLLLGTIDIGRVFFDYIEMRNAVREGAGYGARMPHDNAGITTRVTQHGVPEDTRITVVCTGNCTTTDGVANGTGTIVVSATHTFEPITIGFLQSWFGMDPIVLRVSASMRVLQ